jgi:sulfur relay (sulfurtransferase) DsrF/TusC family protein
MILEVNDLENILKMLNSEDKDNSYVAFKALDSYEFKDTDVNKLLYLYKFSPYSNQQWSENCEKAYKILETCSDLSKPITYAEALSIMINNNAEENILNMFLEKHTKLLTGTLRALGYPADKIELSLKLKK